MSGTTIKRSKLQRESKSFRILAAFAVAITLLCVASQIIAVAAPIWKGGQLIDTLVKVAEQLLLSVPAIIYVYGLISARRIFTRIGQGDLFARANSKGLIVVGGSLLVGAVWSMILGGFIPNAWIYDHEVHRFDFASSDIALAALGLALVMIGRVMAEATRLKADSDGFI